jgi:hypothetical protein
MRDAQDTTVFDRGEGAWINRDTLYGPEVAGPVFSPDGTRR